MIKNVIQKWCETDTQYNEAMKMQKAYDELDPKHENLPHVVVLDCRTKY